MPDYSKSKIYKIVCNITGEIYIGSTTQKLCARLAGHRSDLKKTIRACSAKQILERGNYSIILCEEICCNTKEQLEAIERRWIETNTCINKTIPGRTELEYRNIFPDIIRQRKKEWYERNRERILARVKQYNEINKDKRQEYMREYHKTYNKKD
jgi:hypothetical protein